jgi:signal transduction histidine kinase
MRRVPLTRYLPLAVGALLLALLAVLATLQYRWIGQVSELESHRLVTSLASAGTLCAAELDRELARTYLAFGRGWQEDGPAFAAHVARQHRRWLAEAPYPRLVREIFYVHHDSRGEPAIAVLRPGEPRFEPTDWPPELHDLRRRVSGRAALRLRRLPLLLGGPPSLTIPVVEAWPPPASTPGAPGERSPHSGSARGGPGERSPRPASARGEPEWRGDLLVVRLDEETMAREIFPALTRRHFGSARGAEHVVAVVTRDRPARVVFRSDPAVRLDPRPPLAGDLVLPLFALRAAELRSLERRGVPADAGGGDGTQVRERERREPVARRSAAAEEGEEGGAWALVVRRRNGSLDQAVAGFRRRNLEIGAGILALLAATTALMMVTTQRAQRLARQQLEFVAAVSHELNTPLTAIRSAGQNLADGVVAQPEQVKRYGTLIETEGRRLSAMVGQVLHFAGIQSGRQSYALQPTAVAPLLSAALDDCRPLLAQRRARVECDVAGVLPAVQADPGALRRALRNLIENAAKYGGPEPWIGVRARPAGGEVEIVIEDGGAGVRREELSHLFEPFFRGREAAAGGIPGSGLGLAVVRHIAQAHGGRVSVTAGSAGRGSVFTLHLRVAAAGESRVAAAGESRVAGAGENRVAAAGKHRVAAAGENRVAGAGENRVAGAGENRVAGAGVENRAAEGAAREARPFT